MYDVAILWLSLGAMFGGQATATDEDPSRQSYDHFRGRYELYSTVGDFSAEELRTLTRLNVAGSEFNDDDVPHLAGLASMMELDLTGTLITDEGLKRLGALDLPLRTLILADTQITDAGIGHLSTMLWLEALDLSGTAATGKGVARILSFEGRITSLKLASGTTDSDLEVVPALENLHTLHFPTDKVTPAGMEHVARSKSLRDLRLHGDRLSPKAFAKVASMTQLERLDISGFVKLNDKALKLIRPLQELRFLDVSSTSVTDDGLVHVLELPKLTHLVLSGTGVTDKGLKLLGEMVWGDGDDFTLSTATVITHLELASTAITDRGLKNLKALHLLHLDISRTFVTNRCQRSLTGWKLHSLNIEGEFGLTDLAFVEDLPELQRLDVSHRPRIMSQVSHLGGHPSLAVLDISYTDLMDSAMMKLVRCDAG